MTVLSLSSWDRHQNLVSDRGLVHSTNYMVVADVRKGTAELDLGRFGLVSRIREQICEISAILVPGSEK